MRPKIATAYRDNMAWFLMTARGWSAEKADKFITDVVNARFKDRKVRSQHSKAPGFVEIKECSLYQLLADHADDVIVPSGSIYLSESKRKGVLGEMSEDQMAQRGICKKKMFEAKAKNDKIEEQRWDLMQSIIKIIMNSLPGGFASAFNIFYDKGGYNTITSLARSLIGTAYTSTEQLMCGNFAWFDQDDVLIHINNVLKNAPSQNEILSVISEFKLKQPSKEELITFFYSTVHQYKLARYRMPIVEHMVSVLQPHHVAYLYYYFNLKHLVWDNLHVGLPWVTECITPDISGAEQIDLNEKIKLDDDLVAFITPLVYQQIKYKAKLEDGEFDLSKLKKKCPPVAKEYIAAIKNAETRLNKWKRVLDTFVFRDCGMPNLLKKKNMQRNAVIISDTDSVIFTSKMWMEWYTKDTKVDEAALAIAGFSIYWISKIVEHELIKFSLAHGVVKEKKHIMQMKNEFLYTTLLLFDVKKNYAGLQAIREGLILEPAVPDIKGGQLRGSDRSPEAVKFTENLLVNDILTPAISGKISGRALIKKISDYERHIRASVMKGESDFLKRTSVGMESDYATPLSSQYFYYLAWDEIFSEKYGKIHLPLKGPVAPLLSVTGEYLDWLKREHDTTYTRFNKFINKYGKTPNYILLNQGVDQLPPELAVLIDVRAIIHHNMKSVYMILSRLQIGVGHSNQKMLLSDLYLEDDEILI